MFLPSRVCVCVCVCVDVLYTYMTDSEHLDLVVSQVQGNVRLEDMSDPWYLYLAVSQV